VAFKISLLSDVAGFLKGTDSIEQALDGVADSLDQLATDTAHNADKAGEQLERKFKEAFDEVKTEAKTTGRKVGDDLGDGAHRAREGVSDLKDEVKQSGREMAASFDGSAQSVSDLVQEIAANALPALGPAGAAAGLAMALGLGAGLAALQEAKAKADAASERVHDLADAIADAGGNPDLINWTEQLRDTLKEIVDTKEWYEFWQNAPVDRLSDWTAKTKEFGVAMGDAAKAATGDQDATKKVVDSLNASIADLNRRYLESATVVGAGDQTMVVYDESLKRAADSASSFRDDIAAQSRTVADATAWQRAYSDATKDLSNSQSEAQKAAGDFSAALTDHLSVADEGLNGFVRGAGVKLKDWNKKLKESTGQGVLDVDAWAKEVRQRARENKLILSFTADIDTKLSPEALTNFEKLPADTQAAIARAYKKGDHKKILQTLEAEAKVTKVDVDTSGVKGQTVEIPATVIGTGVPKDVRDAANAGQDEANKTTNHIEFTPRIDVGDLQRAVNRAAASITPPTITVRTKVAKEVP